MATAVERPAAATTTRGVQGDGGSTQPVGGERRGEVVQGFAGGADRLRQGADGRVAGGLRDLLTGGLLTRRRNLDLLVAAESKTLTGADDRGGRRAGQGGDIADAEPDQAGPLVEDHLRDPSLGLAGYIAWLFLCQGPFLPLLAYARRGRALFAQLRPVCGIGLAGGAISLLAYGLVIWAQAHGDLATVAALRETSILVAALIGTLLFREPLGRRRLAAGAAVLAGIVVLELAHV